MSHACKILLKHDLVGTTLAHSGLSIRIVIELLGCNSKSTPDVGETLPEFIQSESLVP